MPNTIQIKKSSVPGKVPATGDLSYGELALNYNDGKLYYKSAANAISQINAKDADTLDGQHASAFVTTTGTQTINGNKTFTAGTVEFTGQNIALANESITIGTTGSFITIGESAGSVSLGFESSILYLGTSASEVRVGDYASMVEVGMSCWSNSFGNYSTYNDFGPNTVNNTFGANAETNHFGGDAITNHFGSFSGDNYYEGKSIIAELDPQAITDPAGMRDLLEVSKSAARERMWEALMVSPIVWGVNPNPTGSATASSNAAGARTVNFSQIGLGALPGTGQGVPLNSDFTVSGAMYLITPSTQTSGPTVTTNATGIVVGTTSFVASADMSNTIYVGNKIKHAALATGTTVTSVSGTTVNFTPAATSSASGAQSVQYLNDSVARFVIGGSNVATTAGRYMDNVTVITTGTYTSGTNTLAVASATSIAVGQAVYGRGIPYGTMVTAINGTTLTLNQNVTTSESARNVEFMALSQSATPTASYTSGQSSMVVSSASGVSVGTYVFGPGITPGTTVAAINGTTLTLSRPTTESASGMMVAIISNTAQAIRATIGIEQYQDPSTFKQMIRIYARLGPLVFTSAGVDFSHIWNYYYKFILDFRVSDGRIRLFMQRQAYDTNSMYNRVITRPSVPNLTLTVPQISNKYTPSWYFSAIHICNAVDGGQTTSNTIGIFNALFQSHVLADDN